MNYFITVNPNHTHYDDEYDDTYDDVNVGANDNDDDDEFVGKRSQRNWKRTGQELEEEKRKEEQKK